VRSGALLYESQIKTRRVMPEASWITRLQSDRRLEAEEEQYTMLPLIDLIELENHGSSTFRLMHKVTSSKSRSPHVECMHFASR
jgi:hypothetical protein